MKYYIRLLKSDDKRLNWALIGSFLFHALLITILATTSIFYPAAGSAEKFEVLWHYFSSVPAEAKTPDNQVEQEKPSPDKTAVAETAEAPPARMEQADEPLEDESADPDPQPVVEQMLPPETKTAAAPTSAARSVAAEAELERQEAEKTAKEATEKARELLAGKKAKLAKEKWESVHLAALKAEQKRQTYERAEQDRNAETAQRTRLAAEKASRDRADQLRLAEEKAESQRLASLKEGKEQLGRETVERERIAVQNAEREQQIAADKSAIEKAEKMRLTREKAERKHLAALKAEQERLSRETAERAKIAAEKEERENRLLPKETAVHKTAGASLIPLRAQGDLKLEITGNEDIKITVLFREYATARRNKPMTKSEAKRGQNVVPVIARIEEKTRAAVIETARAGIYDFMAESAGAKLASASFLLKLHETGSRPKIKSLGKKIIAGKSVIVKVLMPEGILWDDESAFSGSMEDSDSITRFNSETGLVWREYRQ